MFSTQVGKSKAEINEEKKAILKQFKKQQAKFLLHNSTTLADELENHFYTFLEDPEIQSKLQSYEYPEVLRQNCLQLVMGPIVQLVETQNLAVAILFTDRIINLEQADNKNSLDSYIQAFNARISLLPITSTDENDPDKFNLHISLGNLINLFGERYSLFNLYSFKASHFVANTEQQKKLRLELRQFIILLASKIKNYLYEVAREYFIDVDAIMARFLEEESQRNPNQAWKTVLATRHQIQSDDVYAQKYIEEHFKSIIWMIDQERRQFETYARGNERKQIEANISKWIKQAINLLRNLNYLDFIPDINSLFPSPFFSQELKQQYENYSETKLRVIFYKNLKKLGSNVTFDGVLDLPMSTVNQLVYTVTYLSPAFSKLIANCTLAMLENYTALLKLVESYKFDYTTVTYFSADVLKEYLAYLLHGSPTLIPKKQLLAKTLLHTTEDFILARKMAFMNEACLPFLVSLPAWLKSYISQNIRSFAFEQVIQSFTDLYPNGQELFTTLFTLPYFLERFKDKIFCLGEIEELIRLRCSAEQTKVIYSQQGLRSRSFLSLSTQIEMDLRILPLVQEMALHFKHNLSHGLLKLFRNSGIIDAYQSGFFDVDYVKTASMKDLKSVAVSWKQAKQKGIQSVYDPRFAELMRAKEKELFSQTQQLWKVAAQKRPTHERPRTKRLQRG